MGFAWRCFPILGFELKLFGVDGDLNFSFKIDSITLDPDPEPDLDLNWAKILDPDMDPNSMYLDPQHWPAGNPFFSNSMLVTIPVPIVLQPEILYRRVQCYGSGSILDSYPATFWIRIRILNMDPDPNFDSVASM